MVEPDAPLKPTARNDRGHRDQKLVFFPRREIHYLSDQFIQRRGRGASRSATITLVRSLRSANPCLAQKRTSSTPFHAETPTSPCRLPPRARTFSTAVSSPGVS